MNTARTRALAGNLLILLRFAGCEPSRRWLPGRKPQVQANQVILAWGGERGQTFVTDECMI
jgi:hypothetical protein